MSQYTQNLLVREATWQYSPGGTTVLLPKKSSFLGSRQMARRLQNKLDLLLLRSGAVGFGASMRSTGITRNRHLLLDCGASGRALIAIAPPIGLSPISGCTAVRHRTKT